MTIKPLDAIHETTSSLSPISHQLPAFFSKSVKVICAVHAFWRGTRTARAARDAPSFGLYLAGLGLNLAFGDRKGVKVAAQAVLIALRIVECVEHYIALQILYEELVQELTGHAIVPMQTTWKGPKGWIFLSPSIHHAIQWECAVKSHRAKRIATIIARIAYRLFDLSMCILDASKAFSLDNEHVSDNVNELFLNSYDLWQKLTTDMPFLQEKLQEHSHTIDTLISKTSRSPLKTVHLLKVCTFAGDLRQAADNTIEAIASAGQKVLGVEHLPPAQRCIDDSRISTPPWVECAAALKGQ
jgi:hypothetical protein